MEGFEGYWGPPTATMDWCEGNYMVTLGLAFRAVWGLGFAWAVTNNGSLVRMLLSITLPYPNTPN